jgi:hypothetical protein
MLCEGLGLYAKLQLLRQRHDREQKAATGVRAGASVAKVWTRLDDNEWYTAGHTKVCFSFLEAIGLQIIRQVICYGAV